MHAQWIVQRFFDQHLLAMHDTWRRVLEVPVWGAMLGSALSLSQLARSLSGHERSTKACLKRVDHRRQPTSLTFLIQQLLRSALL